MAEHNQRGMTTQDTILSALAELVSTRPYASFSVNEVNATAGASKTQFYHHFSSKDAAAAEFVRIETGKAWASVDRRIDTRTSSIELLVATVLDLTGHLLTTPRFRAALIIAGEIGRDSSLHIDFFGDWRSRMVTIVDEAKAAGDVGADVDAAEFATQLVATWNGLRIFADTLDGPSGFVDRVAAMLGLFVGSIVVAGRGDYVRTFAERYADRIAQEHRDDASRSA